jgi:hypothetical protein
MRSGNSILLTTAVSSVAMAFTACKAKSESDQPASRAEKKTPPSHGGDQSAPPATSGRERPGGEKDSGEPVIKVSDVGLTTPESVLYDAARDRYLVSNINGSPAEADDNGFISALSPEGKLIELKWIDGSKAEVTLNAPKGTALRENVLYVADISTVRKFAADTGKPLGDVPITGATFLNDVTLGKDGAIYVSDTGMNKEFKPTKTDAIYRIGKDDKAEKVASGAELGMPNGLAPADDGVWVVTFGSGQLYQITAAGQRRPGPATGAAQLDGLLALDDGTLVFSSWEKKSLLRGPKSGPFATVMSDIESPADIGWDDKRKRVLIPLFNKNEVWIRTL